LHKLFKNTGFIGKKAFFLPSCHSTNEVASMLLTKQEELNGTVVYTDYQTAGKGQRGNIWESEPEANVLLSIILQTDFIDPTDYFDLTVITSLALHDLLTDYFNSGFKIKWPNDLYFRNKKIAGILIENYIKNNTIERCIMGIGLNVNQLHFEEKIAVSLAQICEQTFDRKELTNVLLQKVEARFMALKRGKKSGLLRDYKSNLYWKNELHVFQSEGTYFNGKIVDVESSGKLKIKTEDGVRYFDFKEVQFIK